MRSKNTSLRTIYFIPLDQNIFVKIHLDLPDLVIITLSLRDELYFVHHPFITGFNASICWVQSNVIFILTALKHIRIHIIQLSSW